jgi:hypothetical protein
VGKFALKRRIYKICAMLGVGCLTVVLLNNPAIAVGRAISNALNSFLDSIARILANAVTEIFALIQDILGYSLNIDTENASLFSPGGQIAQNPQNWNGGGTWTLIQNISETAIVPIAIMVLTIVLVIDLVQTLTAGNQFENAGIAPFVKWTIKTMIGITLVSNIFTIASGVFTLGVEAGGTALIHLLGFNDTLSMNLGDVTSDDIGILICVLLIAVFTLLAVCLLLVSILVTLAGRMIEIFMYLSVAPLTAAAFMNSEWRNTSNNWLKGIIALAFQGFFIVIAIAIFTAIFGGVCNEINATVAAGDRLGFNLILGMLILLGYSLALIFTIFRSGQISKSIFSAH